MTTLCAADSCIWHVADCPREDCACPPALAAPGSLVCGWHADRTREHLRELPELWAILGAKPAPGLTGGGSSRRSKSEPPQPIGDRARWARSGMKAMLVTWCLILEEERGSPLPDEQVIARRTRAEIVRLRSDRDIAYDAFRASRKESDYAQGWAADCRAIELQDARETGADVIEALREHVDRHLAWLLNGEHADQLVHDVSTWWQECRRRAYPGTPAGHVIGACPLVTDAAAGVCAGSIRAVITAPADDPGEKGWAQCGTCKQAAVISWWLERMPPEHREWMTMSDLRGHLLVVHAADVPEGTIRRWAALPLVAPQLPTRRQAGAGRDGEAIERVVYERESAVRLARARATKGMIEA